MVGLLGVLPLLLLASVAGAEPLQLAAPTNPVPPVPEPSAQTSAQVERHFVLGQKLLQRHEAALAVSEFALAHAFAARPVLLIETARACQRAGHDDEALAIYLRLQQEGPAVYRSEADEAIPLLRAKLEDLELDSALVLRDRMEHAKQQFLSGNYEAATRAYALAYAIKPLPRLLFNIAQAFRRIKRAEEAYLLYARFLNQDPSTPLRREILSSLEEIKDAAFPKPIYKRASFWGVLIAVTITGVAVGVGLGLGLRENPVVLRFNFQ